ncbi:putative protease inhibitor [Xylariomycetidae sp. FL2044]|nr:putative protease inhibitor [Xylariomycetidae sp. FL2044]
MPVNQSVKTALELIENDKSKLLGLTVGKHSNIQTGQLIPKADAQSPPDLTSSSISPEGTYLAICLDLDAPHPSFSVLGPILHWIQPGLKASPLAEGGFSLKSTEPFIANWIAPRPPPPKKPHRYVIFLYEHPAGFDVKQHAPPNGAEFAMGGRIRYDLDKWAAKVNLGPLLAANYFKSV